MLLRTALRLPSPDPLKPVVALTGAGGKSTLLFRLGEELAAAGLQTLMTSTTRLWAQQIDRAPFSLIAADPLLLSVELPISLRGYKWVLAMAGPAREPDKLRGLAPNTICRLAALGDVDAVVVEADGSRERPLKAPAEHEPVVPACATHAVVVAGLVAMGRPLDRASVHRPELVAALAGLQIGDALTPAAVARLLAHPHGGLKGVPPHATPFLYLNLMLDSTTPVEEAERRLAAARAVAGRVLDARAETGSIPQDPVSGARYGAVLVGSAQAESPVLEVHSRVAGIVLAAGGATRFDSTGTPKQLLPWGDGNTLAGHAVDTALAATTVGEVLAVTGYRADAVAAAIAHRPARVVANPAWQAGQSSSVHAALAALAPDVGAAVFLLADQPDVHPQTIDALVAAHRQTLAPIVAPVYRNGKRGNPVLFDRATFPELLALQGDTGGRPLIERYGAAVQLVPIDLPQPEGIETREVYERRTRDSAQRET